MEVMRATEEWQRAGAYYVRIQTMAKDRLNPCIHYVCKGETCKKGFKDVTLAKCKTCEKYRPRKSGQKQESVKQKRQKDKDRHDNWRNY